MSTGCRASFSRQHPGINGALPIYEREFGPKHDRTKEVWTNSYLGQQLGHYLLVDLLGKGGFANVYLGKHTDLPIKAAVKVLHQTHLVEQKDRDEFYKEARTLFDLKHPHIVHVHDFGVKGGVSFLVMEYAPNGTLHDAHRRGDPLPPTQVVAYVDQIADALQYLHDRDLMHLDLKPHNILLGARGELLLSDFGLVQDVHNTASQSIPERVLGTPPFMDPGYMLGGPPRRASDQYALGVMVYEWLSGRRPFRNEMIADQHLHNVRPQPLYGDISGISRKIEQVVFRALEKDPNDRFPDVKAFAEAFARACGDSSSSGERERQAFRREMRAFRRERQAFQSERQALQDRVRNTDQENQTLQSENQELQDRVINIDQENQILQSENQELQDRVRNTNQENQTLRRDKQELRRNNEGLQRDKQELQQNNERLKNKVNDIQRENQALQSKKQHWKNAYKELRSKMQNMDQNKQQSTVPDGTSSLLREGRSSSQPTGREGTIHETEQQLLDRLKRLGFKPNDTAWLESDDGQTFLGKHMSDFAKTEQGKAWLESDNGLKWLGYSDNGSKWLNSDDGIDWINSDNGLKWPQLAWL